MTTEQAKKILETYPVDETTWGEMIIACRMGAEALKNTKNLNDEKFNLITELVKCQDENKELKEQIPRWISVEEKLPKENETILIIDKSGEVWAGCYYSKIGFISPVTWGIDYTIHNDITHWMKIILPKLCQKKTE